MTDAHIHPREMSAERRPSPARTAKRSVARFGTVATVRSARTYERLAKRAGDAKAVRYWRTIARRANRYRHD